MTISVTTELIGAILEMMKNERMTRYLIEIRMLMTQQKQTSRNDFFTRASRWSYLSETPNTIVADVGLLPPIKLIEVIEEIQFASLNGNIPLRLCDNAIEAVYRMTD
jgi:hypothetical protein